MPGRGARMTGKKRMAVRKIHVNLSEDLHRKLRIKCALDDVSIQEAVEKLVTAYVRDVAAFLRGAERGRGRDGESDHSRR
jgi:hypothetical protein